MATAKKKVSAVSAPKKAAVRKTVRKSNAPVDELVSQDDLQDLDDMLQEAPQSVTPCAKLDDADVLDIRALSLLGRVGLADLLKQEGYIWADGLASLYDLSRLPCLLEAEVLRLNNQNKLVFPQSWNDVSVIDMICEVKVSTDVEVFLEQPSVKYPETIEVGEATYLRVN